MNEFTKDELDYWAPYSPPPRCDKCQSDTAECWPSDNKYGYTGLCKDCYMDFSYE